MSIDIDVENRRSVQQMQYVAKGKKLGDILAYFVALIVLAAISTLVMVFYSIRTAYDQLPERLHANTLTRAHQE
jgi:hypothetical protein